MNPSDVSASLVVWLNLAATLFMVGVIWYVQLVHYPLMSSVDRSRFPDFHREHGRRTAWVVIGPMLVEAITALLLVVPGVTTIPRSMAITGFLLMVLIWLSTFGIQVPLHRQLARRFEPVVHRRLVVSNWVRTVAWSLRAVIVLRMVAGVT